MSTPSHSAVSPLPAPAEKLDPDYLRDSRVYDHDDVQRTFVRSLEDGELEAALVLEGIRCAGCARYSTR